MRVKNLFHIGNSDQSRNFPTSSFNYQWISPDYDPIKDADGYNFFLDRNNNPNLFLIEKDAYHFMRYEVVEQLPAYQTYLSKEVVYTDEIGRILLMKNVQVLSLNDYGWAFNYLIDNFDYKPYGMIIHSEKIDINDSFNGNVIKKGNVYMEFDGNFGEVFSQTISFKDFQYYRDKIEFYPEITVEGENIEVFFRLYYIDLNTGQYIGSTDVTMERLRNGAIFIELGEENRNVSVSLFAKGVGCIYIGNIHLRIAPRDGSISQVGGKKIIDDEYVNNELFYYFHPGNMKPPFAVYFSGYRPVEGFEGRFMIGAFDCPFMLIHDPRLEGGSFYLGSAAFEEEVKKIILEKLFFLGFNKSQLILSGLSMGTFGALYYGSKIEPAYIIAGKPLIHLGDIMLNERINRHGGFPTSYDIQLQHEGELSVNKAKKLNNRFWDSFKKADFSRTSFIFSYMKQDDYDPLAFPKCFQYLRENYPGTKIVYKGFEGRHTDPSSANEWFIKQYKIVLKNYFTR